MKPPQLPRLAYQEVTMDYNTNGRHQRVLDNVSFCIPAGRFVALVGPTGCGKTTLLRLGAGLFRPSGGSILLDGQPVDGPNRRVALLFQRPVFLPWRTVGQNLSLPCELAGLPVPEWQPRIEQFLRVAGLQHFRSAYPRELSGGMQQILSLCMALVLDPDLLLMDEPFSALDALTREQVSASFLDLWSAYQKTVLFVTHSISEAIYLSDEVVVMSGRPGRFIDSIPNPLPRPRTLSMIEEPDFQELTNAVRRLLQKGRSR